MLRQLLLPRVSGLGFGLAFLLVCSQGVELNETEFESEARPVKLDVEARVFGEAQNRQEFASEQVVESPTLEIVNSNKHHRQPQPQPVFMGNQFYHNQRGVKGSSHLNRPTLENLRPEEAASVNTPEQLLKYCCQFPACYDPLYELCIDTCRKCETVFPVTSWLPCPPLLNIPDCTSDNLSGQGRLPLACYPDIGPFANILPISQVMQVSSFYHPSGRRMSPGSDPSSSNEQAYRRVVQERNKKNCNHLEGVCRSETLQEFHGFGRR